ncbi:MAG TPA: ATP-binding protein [Vicinamibacterales bacterium]|nr:ATP-binding protein [Vicinamibacterales bacterium]
MQNVFEQGGEVGALMRDMDWTGTALGPPDDWPQSLRIVVRIMLTSRFAMWIGWGPELSFLYNDAYARMSLGPRHPSALGRPAREVWAEIWKDVSPRIDQVMSSGRATWDEGLMLIVLRYGYPEETYHTFSYSPLFDDSGTIAGNLCVVTEETERIIGERRLGALQMLASMLAGANEAQEVYAAVETCAAANGRDIPFALLYAVDEASAHATLVARSGITEDHQAAPSQAALEDGGPWPFARVLQGSDDLIVDHRAGDAAWPSGPWDVPVTRAVMLPITLQGQLRPSYVFIAGHNPYRPLDESCRSFLGLLVGQIASGLANARVYEDERRRAEALAALDRAKTAFFSNVSHEFRTPLTLMLGPTEDALAHGGVMHRPELETVYRNQLRLLKLVNSLLDFSRAEAGRAQATYEPIDLAALTTDLASNFRSAIERGGLAFEVDCPPLPEPVFVDRQMWEKIVLNLLSNAFKFTLEGSIRVAIRAARGAVTLSVEDTGVGIPEAEQPRVFERFHRIEGTRARTHEGTGIGLALVQDLVALHGGAITVESQPGRGTTFSVTIPLGAAHLPAERIGSAPALASSAIGVQPFFVEAERWLESAAAPDLAVDEAPIEAGPPERGRILVADDNLDMRDYLRRLLSPRWVVDTARDGREALARMQRHRADLVITDVMMPELDGFGLLAALRANPETRDVPVMMLSARAGEEMRLEGLQAGADEYLVKPFSARELTARVETLLIRASMHAVENLQRRQLVDIFRQVPAAMAILRGPDHVFEHANPAYLALIGNRDVIGKPVREALPELDGQGVYELLDGVFTTGQPYVGSELRLRVERTRGEAPEELFFDFVYQPLRDATQQIDGIAVVVFEVSELVRARSDAESASRAKDEFLAMLGHELRNPLAPILTALQLMRLRGGAALEHERTVIERQTRHLVRLVDDLLDVSRIARGKIELRRERLDVADAVAKAIEMASPLLEERKHRLDVRVPRGLDVVADPARLAQIVANLLTNAAKYTDGGGRVVIKGALEGDMVAVRVADTGIGIDPMMLPRVFEMFTQERQTLDRTAGGLGLGLTIVRNLVQLHGGTVEAYSEGRGRGSEFVVRLPAAPSAHEAAALAEAASAERDLPREGLPVLVVDDNADAADMLREYVGALGYRVTVALDSLAALRAADENPPAIALLDIGLPVMDGFELARRFRESDRHAAIKLVAITGYGQETDRQRSRDAGFDAHLVKPVDMDQLEHLLSVLTTGLR